MNCLAYLRDHPNYGPTYGPGHSPLAGYSDADFAGCLDTSRSTTGWLFMRNGGPVSWRSKLQSSVSDSTTVRRLNIGLSLNVVARVSGLERCVLTSTGHARTPLRYMRTMRRALSGVRIRSTTRNRSTSGVMCTRSESRCKSSSTSLSWWLRLVSSGPTAPRSRSTLYSTVLR